MIENPQLFNSGKRGRFGKNLTLVPLQFKDVLSILSQYNPKKNNQQSGDQDVEKEPE